MIRSRRVHDLLAGAAATAGVLGIVVGVPIALVAAVGWPLGRSVPSIDTVVIALRYGQIAPSTMLRSLAVVLWVAWALSVVSIALEAVAVARGTVARALPGIRTLQTAAAHLVATIMLLSSLSSRALALPAEPTSAATVAVATHERTAPARVTPHAQAPPERTGHRSGDAAARYWTVRRRDSLWSIAERTLGDGRRWKEIAALNEDRTQPDGGRLRQGDTMIHPGWRLMLPSDPAPERPARVTVADGDSLWDIAAERLGDGERWREIYERNRGRRQDDGGHLADPDLIRPGWVLRLPTERRTAARDQRGDTAVTDRSAPRGARGTGGAAPTPPTAPDTADRRGNEPPGQREAPPGTADRRRDEPTVPPAADAPPVAPPVTPATLAGEGRAARRPGSAPPAADRRRRGIAPATQPVSQRAPAGPADQRTVVVGAAGLLAAALVGLIARRRRHWLRRRTVGAVLAPVDPEAAELERWLRSMAEHDLHERLDRVLRVLTDHLAEHTVAPAILAVELGEQVALRLAEPPPQPPPQVTSSEDGHRWTLARELEMAPTAPRRYVPALAACGRLPSGALLLVNPLATAVLGVVGSRDQTADVLTSWTAELATGGASAGMDVVVVGRHHPLIERLPGVTIVRDDTEAIERVRRVTGDRAGFASHVVVVHGDPVESEMFDALVREARHPRVGLVVAGDGRATACLEIAGPHTRLTPDDAWIDAPEWLTPLQWDRFGDLLRHPGRDRVHHPVPTALVSVATLESGEPVTDAPLDIDDPALVEVGIFGPLTVDGRVASLDADAASVLTYLATHPTGADPATIAAMLWPSRPDRAERLTRSLDAVAGALGPVDAAVVHTDDGRVELSSAVATDLRAFHALLHGLAQHPGAVQGRRLHAALELVRGEPFAAGADWAHADGLATGTAGLVIDVAHRLAMQALTVGDVDHADWAVDRGLLAAPGCELLYRDRMRIADARGDHAALDACMRALTTLVEADGGRVTPETVDFYEQLRGDGTATAREDAS